MAVIDVVILNLKIYKLNMEKDNPFKPNTSRVDRLETQILILMERVATLERDLTYHIKESERC